MKIEKTTLSIWIKHFNNLDVSRAAREMGITSATVYNALNGSCSQSTHDKINLYLLERKRMLNELKD
jgi:predicted XRE-type DNA-binding protein